MFSQEIANYNIPEISSKDDLIENLALQLKNYINATLGQAWLLLNSGDSNIIKNIHFINPAFIIETIAPQLPCLFVYRRESERKFFTLTKDKMVSKIEVVFLSNMFRTVDLDKRYSILDAIPKAIESMCRRHRTIDGYELEACLNIESIRVDKISIDEMKQRYANIPGYYQSITTLLVEEIVNEAIEDEEDLENLDLVYGLGATEEDLELTTLIEQEIIIL